MIFGFGEDDDEAESTDEDGDASEGTDTEAVDAGDVGAVADAETDTHESGEPDGAADAPSEHEPGDDDANDTPDADTDASDGEADEGDESDEDIDPESISAIDRIVLDPEKLVEMLAYNGQEDIGQKSKAVYSLQPPFAPAVEPALKHLEEKSTEGKADDEIHLRPFRFVVDGRAVIEQRPTRQVATEEIDAEDPTDAAIEAWIDEAMETWKGHVRENLAESVDIFSPHGMAIVDVEYDPEPEAEAEDDSHSETEAGE
ncbi:MAG: hypothetical protein ACI9TI_002065 [Natronomonas sp.]|mgnify:CR=1 FL=1|jgi:hypothetical protein|uniref:hypothetical protein n=1 Tax=Natronomonas sp. TaxID=2184060 RepID=UPI003988C848